MMPKFPCSWPGGGKFLLLLADYQSEGKKEKGGDPRKRVTNSCSSDHSKCGRKVTWFHALQIFGRSRFLFWCTDSLAKIYPRQGDGQEVIIMETLDDRFFLHQCIWTLQCISISHVAEVKVVSFSNRPKATWPCWNGKRRRFGWELAPFYRRSKAVITRFRNAAVEENHWRQHHQPPHHSLHFKYGDPIRRPTHSKSVLLLLPHLKRFECVCNPPLVLKRLPLPDAMIIPRSGSKTEKQEEEELIPASVLNVGTECDIEIVNRPRLRSFVNWPADQIGSRSELHFL